MSEIKFALSRVAIQSKIPSFTKSEIVEKVNNLPHHIESFNSQLAGHDYAIFYDKSNGFVLKLISDIRGVREEIFYRLLFDPKNDKDPSLVKLRSFVPIYVCTQLINDAYFLTLRDLTLNIINPSLMDVKIGKITYDRNATKEKISRESAKNYLSKKFGFRVLAIKKWVEEKKDYEKMDRSFCRKCTFEEEKKIILFYLEQLTKDKTVELKNSITAQLNQIKDWFNKENVDLFEFIGSSVLFVYSFANNKLDCHVKMIDFAHIYPLEGSKVNLGDDKKDQNYIQGLNSLIDLVQNFN